MALYYKKHYRKRSLIKVTGFKEKVLSVVGSIPKGKTLTYKDVAVKAGSSRAYRAVGSILKTNFNKSIPCHRVIKSNGDLGEYNRGRSKKSALLRREKAVNY